MGARLGGWVLVGEQKKELDLSGAGAREHGSPGPWAAVMGSAVGFTFPPKVSSVPSNPTTEREASHPDEAKADAESQRGKTCPGPHRPALKPHAS